MKKLFFIFALCLILVGCGNNNEDNQDTTTITQTTTIEETTTLEETTTQTTLDNVLIMTDPNNEYQNNRFIFTFDGDTLKSVEFIIAFDNLEDALLGEELYNAYADQYESVTLDDLILSVVYGPDPKTQYEGFTKPELQANLESQGLVVGE